MIQSQRVTQEWAGEMFHLVAVYATGFFSSFFAADALKTVWPSGTVDFTGSSLLVGACRTLVRRRTHRREPPANSAAGGSGFV